MKGWTMPKLESGYARLLSVDTDNKIMQFEELKTDPSKQYEVPYESPQNPVRLYQFVGRKVRYVLSDGKVVEMSLE